MPISLTTLAPGAPTSAVALRDLTTQIETYVNEQTVAADRTTAWLQSVHVFRPDFQYALASREVPMPGGHIFWNTRNSGRTTAQLFSYYQGSDAISIPGLSRTIQIPEGIGADYAVLVRASFVAYEYGGRANAAGGANPGDSDYGIASRCATFALQVNDDSPINATARPLYTASDMDIAIPYISRFLARKQHTILYAIDGTTLGGAGLHDIKIVCEPVTPSSGELWKHILVTQGCMIARCRLR
jgi:hypothetical protein